MDGWVGHVGWPIADVWPTKWSSVQLAVWRRTGEVRRSNHRSTTVLRRQLTNVLLLFFSFIHLLFSCGLSTHNKHDDDDDDDGQDGTQYEMKYKFRCSNPCTPHCCTPIVIITLTFDLSIPKPCHVKVIPYYTKFEHFGIIRVELCSEHNMHLLTLWPWPLRLWPFNPKTMHSLSLAVYPKDIPYTKFEHFGSFIFELCCGQTDRQTDKQTDSKILPAPTDTVSVGNQHCIHNTRYKIVSLIF